MSETTLTADERSCCHLLSELFLDIVLEDDDYKYVATGLRELALSLDQIEHMFWYEVYPILIYNIAITAGEWIQFDMDWLCGEIETRRAKTLLNAIRTSWLPISWGLWSGMVSKLWDEVKKRYLQLQERSLQRTAIPFSHRRIRSDSLLTPQDPSTAIQFSHRRMRSDSLLTP
ncbi:hypothetical protein K469DRAFT_679412 [Zopfia rhizophila CBS 207.26]|uniref:DUF7079 domain-containing protein n=1 Tax=Zopfia rhizophila CBS 207.26 TaxID=1314779 RepID=A0A6A6DBH5_9PEZI|nr:hypothetical protein K469DRAFT_679412 [Zopfia rhizophila CBS 207.26]